MRILVDADACPVKEEIINVAKKYNIEVKMYIDTSHELYLDYPEIIMVDKGMDAVDFRIINDTIKEDIIVTQDYGLASLILPKEAYAIDLNGKEYTDDNIEILLHQRYIGKQNRKKGIYNNRKSKRKAKQNEKFKNNLTKLIKRIGD